MNEVRGLEYVKIIKETKIGIGVNLKENIPYYTSDRLTHYMMFGTFFMTYYFPNILDLFSKDELIYYENIQDLDEKIKFYLKNDTERERIARNGQKKILEKYNTKNIVKMMLEILENGNSNMFSWVQVYK
jgi:spore maturation protein CgeB